MRNYFLIFIAVILANHHSNSQELEGSAYPVFVSGNEGYACFRIPAIVKLFDGSLLALAEGRKAGCSDTGDIDLVSKRSSDGGNTWSTLQLIWDDGENTCGNPVPIIDQNNQRLHLLSTWNLGSDHEREIIAGTSTDTRRIYYLYSDDGGLSWSVPEEITSQVKLPDWTWYATGPGSGIQLQLGKDAGRLMAGCDHIEANSKKYYSHVIYSDDSGTTWKLGGSSPNDQVNECEVAETTDGQLILNMRNYDRKQKTRQIAISRDGGLSWIHQHHDSTLIEPICQASLHRHDHYLLFSNPASSEKRTHMTVRSSLDNGKTWTTQTLLHNGPSAYSDLVSLDAHIVGCLFESGENSPYEKIIFQRMHFK